MESRTAQSDAGRAFQQQMTRGVACFLALAAVLRLVRAIQIYPLWCDETMLAANLLDRDWTQLAQPLAYRQVCPLGFLALEWLAVKTFEFSELSLRLVPLICALLSVPFFYLLARRILGVGTAATFVAVAIFAVSEPLIRYAGEAKPYEADFLMSVIMLWLASKWMRAPERATGLWALAATVPIAMAVSLPAVFMIAAIASCGLYVLVKRRVRTAIWAYAAFVSSAGASAASLAYLGQYRLMPADRQYFLKFWAQAFPPSWRNPLALGGWLIRANTGPLFAFPHGSDLGLAWLSPVIFACFALGVFICLRKSKGTTALLVLPLFLTLAAAVLRRYPYGMSVRVNLYLVPAILMLASLGVVRICSYGARVANPRKIVFALGAMLALYGTCRLCNDLGHPYRAPWDRTAREFARWFWEEMSADGEVVCVRSDLKIPFRNSAWAYDGADQYLCYQRIYSRRHREKRAPNWASITAQHPLRCVLVSRTPEEVPGFRQWISDHRDRYTLKDVHTYPATRGSSAEPAIFYVVCEFVPTSVALAPGEPRR